MRKTIMLLLLTFTITLSFSQESNEKWGTIEIRRVKKGKILPKLVAKKKHRSQVFIMRSNGYTYKETFPKGYQSELFPLFFNNGGLILADENEQWSNNTIIGYDYEIFIGNASGGKNNVSRWDINSIIRNLPLVHYIWISGLYYSDSKGNFHFNEIGEFKIERIN